MRATYNNYNFTSRRENGFTRNQNSIKYKSPIKLGPITHTVFIGLVIMVLGLIYLTQAAKVTNYDYEAEKIDAQISELTDKKQDLEIENARLTALTNISSSDVAASMVNPASVDTVGN